MKTWQIAVVVVVVVAVAVGGFFGGRATAGSKTPTVQEAMKVLQTQQANGTTSGTGFTGAGGAARRGNAVSGSIIEADSGSITIKTTDGSSKIVLLSSSTVVSKVTEGSLSDLTTGQDVAVTGTTNSDGTVTATRVQVGALLTTTGSGAGMRGTGGPPSGMDGSGGPSGSMPAGGPPSS